MNKHQKSLLIYSVLVAIIMSVSFVAGSTYTKNNIENKINIANSSSAQTLVDFEPFWKVWKVLDEKYVSSTTTSDQAKVWGAIKGLAASEGDPYTVFFPPEESKMFESEISGNFEGVGFEVGIRDSILTVIAPLKNSPAEKAGVRAGDKIVKIDDKSTTDMNIESAIKLLRGPKGTPVVLTILRVDNPGFIQKTIIRDVIDIPTIDTEINATNSSSGGKNEHEKTLLLRQEGIFIIRLYSFTAQSPQLFRNALREFIESGADKLIIDLRGNPGGYLEAAVDMASWFLPAGKIVLTEDFGSNRPQKIHRSKGYNIFGDSVKLVILVDGGSASASEILSGALREYDKAVLVGAKTFGKGSVQELVKITPETSLKVTIARWFTPKGNSISESGITPDHIVPYTDADHKANKDPQLDKAVEILRGMK
jgi:carboxyl-terminal processing protease